MLRAASPVPPLNGVDGQGFAQGRPDLGGQHFGREVGFGDDLSDLPSQSLMVCWGEDLRRHHYDSGPGASGLFAEGF